MKHLRKFNESVSGDFPKDPNEIRRICEEFGIIPSKIHPDGAVDVIGNVDFNPIPSLPRVPSFMLYHETKNPYDAEIFKEGRLPIKFGVVTQGFNIRGGGLTTLEGSPRRAKYFTCKNNHYLTDLKGGPEKVDLNFFIEGCDRLTSLEGCPKYVGQGFLVKSCERLWDIMSLKDIFFEKKCVLNFTHTPIKDFVTIFGQEKFIDSIVFNYIRKTPQYSKAINLFRFKEALEDAEIPIQKVYEESPQWFQRTEHEIPVPKYFGRYWQWVFVNDEGQRVNFNGERF